MATETDSLRRTIQESEPLDVLSQAVDLLAGIVVDRDDLYSQFMEPDMLRRAFHDLLVVRDKTAAMNRP